MCVLGCAFKPANDYIASQPVFIYEAVGHIPQGYFVRHTRQPTRGTFLVAADREP